MRLGWKALVPLSLLWILVVFALRTYRTVGSGDVTVVLLTLGIVVVAVLVVAFLVRTGSGPRRRRSSWRPTTRCPRWTSWSPTRPGRAGARSRRRRTRGRRREAGATRPGRHRRRGSPARHRLLDQESE